MRLGTCRLKVPIVISRLSMEWAQTKLLYQVADRVMQYRWLKAVTSNASLKIIATEVARIRCTTRTTPIPTKNSTSPQTPPASHRRPTLLDQNIIAAGGSVGQIFGSAIGRALAPNNQFAQLAAGTVAGLIGQKLLQTFTASLTLDASRFVAGDFASVSGLDVANAGIGAISSFLTAELGHELGFTGLAGELFNAGAGGVTGSVLNQVTTKIATGASFDAAIGAINWSTAATQAGYNISAAVRFLPRA